MADLPFTVNMSGTIAGSGSLTLSYQIPTNQKLTIKRLVSKSTGIFDITDIYDSEGMRYTNATQNNGIDSDQLIDSEDDYHGINPFSKELVLDGGRTIYFELLDTSTSSNPVELTLECIRHLQG